MADRKKGASPYATGGGGVTLERVYGATLLSAVLVGDPVPGLGDDMRAVRVHAQSGPGNTVDDYLVEGENALTGTSRRLSVGVRRNPTIGPSDAKFVKLLGDFVRTALDHAPEVDADRWRLALAVAGPHTGAMETKDLTDFARSHANNDSFRETVARPGVTRRRIRSRLQLLDRAVDDAVSANGLTARAGDCRVLTWRLLRALHVLLLRLEGDDATDRTHVVTRLRSLAEDPADAEGVFRALCDMVAKHAPRAANIDEGMIRRGLCGVARLRGSVALARAWSVFSTCEEQLKARTRSALSDPSSGTPLTLGRQDLLDRLAAEMRAIGQSAGSVLVTGTPDVGKSALTLAAVDLLTAKRASATIAFSLRDLPRSAIDFEQLLGASLAVVFGGMAVADSRLVVIDGAEAVLEGKEELLAHVARAASRAGVGVVAVAREDAGAATARAILVPGAGAVKELTIPGLTEPEVAQVLERFPVLARVGRDPRSRWLVARPGLVEILLQSGAHAALPDGALSEADVFAAVWARLVRRDEVVVAGAATPDGREAALLALARKPFDAQAAPVVQDPLALPSLRSDRLLLPVGPTAAWRAGDDFANDVVRDFATARLFITAHAENLLTHANAPRWSLRAARLACQSSLVEAGATSENVRAALQSSFNSLAEAHGDRWADVPWEAVITLGSGRAVLQGAIPWLLEHQGAGLSHLLRVVRQRFLRGGVAPDVIFVEPVVEFLCDQRAAMSTLPREINDAADEIVAAWLASLAIRGRQDVSHPLRCRVREELLVGAHERRDGHRTRCLGLLGRDLDAPSEAALRDLARDAPSDLHPCVEHPLASISLSVHRLDLLLAMTEAYYVEQPRRDDGLFRYRHRLHDEGIRRHHRVGGRGSPPASPSYGPFGCLLRASFPRAVVATNRMLNHAARYRVAREDVSNPTGIALDQLPGVEIDLPELGRRRFVGDSHVWRWYRGTAVGPYPCISALLAIERLLDEILATSDVGSAGALLVRLVSILLQDCENLAIPGLIVGTLTRYAHVAPLELLAPWIGSLDVWELEFERATHELQPFRAHGSDPENQPGSVGRRWSFRELGQVLVARALLEDDRARLVALNAIGNAMRERAAQCVEESRSAAKPSDLEAAAEFNESAASDRIATVRGWASSFQHVHFRIERDEHGRVAVRYEPPSDVVERFGPERRDRECGQQAWHLAHLYTVGDTAMWNATLLSDVATAREIEAEPPAAGPPDVLGPPTAVAAGALASLASGFTGLRPEDVEWAVDTVVRATLRLSGEGLAEDQDVAPWGADRAAARSLSHVLTLPDGAVDDERRRQAADAVRSLASSPSEEVRRILAVALRSLWDSPCRRVGEKCIHTLVFEGFRHAARFARVAGLDATSGRRSIHALDADVESALAAVAPGELSIDRLVAPLVVAAACACSQCCAREPAQALRDALLEAHRRASVYYARMNFQDSEQNDRLVAEALLDGGEDLLILHVQAATGHARALDVALRSLVVVATADARRRRALSTAWPAVMDTVLDAVAAGCGLREERYAGLRALAGVVPRPIPTGRESDVEGVVHAAAEGWPTVAAIEQRIERWLPWAAGSPEAVDALVGLLRTAPLAEQVNRLPWVMRIVSGDFGGIANRSYCLPSWLEGMRASGLLDGAALGEYQRMVDGLTAAGDSRALRLQLALEQ